MIGVLALQGGFREHVKCLRGLGQETVEVRGPEQLPGLSGLVFPGGESTAQWLLIERLGLRAALRTAWQDGAQVLATCAGAILCAREVVGPSQPSLGWIDITIRRNAWGRQLDSFDAVSDQGAPLCFIRAPRIERVGSGVEVLATYRDEPIMVRQGRVVATTFHPELTLDTSVHRLLLS